MKTTINESVVLSSLNKGVRIIKFNRSNKKNAISTEVYEEITHILNTDAVDDNVVVTILTGVGEYYSSGNDISSAMDGSIDTEKRFKMVQDFVEAFITYPKLLIAVVNGPAIGIAVTTLALCDIVYASEKATFETPFLRLGLCAEGASTYTFPLALGRSLASEMIFINKKLTAQEAYNRGLISKIVPHHKLDELILDLQKYGSLPVNSVKTNKRLLTQNFKEILCECNNREVVALKDCINSEEFSNAIALYLSRKSKL